MNSRELPTDRLATTDQEGNRIYLYPADVRGRFRNLRSKVNFVLVFIFLILPWTKVNHHQTILLDIPQRRFAIFGLTFWAHDAPTLIFIFFGAAIALAFVTAIWGRIWCGWTCPQTVFIDGVFRRIERWIEGDAFERRKLDSSPMNRNKFIKKTTKWFLFTLMAMVVSHSFLAYFVGTEVLAKMIRSSPFENQTSFFIMLSITGAILFDFGWFREQFCTLVCPYGRFQSVLMDEQSLVVAYDQKRGEPRKGSDSSSNLRGDCVNCYRCVQVCPTGIDIRRGVQLECIACTACIDACDEVMARQKKPLGLIRYAANSLSQSFAQTDRAWYSRPRIIISGVLLLICGIGLAVTVSKRTPLEVTLIRAPDAPYQEMKLSDGTEMIINHYKIDLQNQTFETQKITFSVPREVENEKVRLITSNHRPILNSGETERADLFIQFPKSKLVSGHTTIPIIITGEAGDSSIQTITVKEEIYVVGPFK